MHGFPDARAVQRTTETEVRERTSCTAVRVRRFALRIVLVGSAACGLVAAAGAAAHADPIDPTTAVPATLGSATAATDTIEATTSATIDAVTGATTAATTSTTADAVATVVDTVYEAADGAATVADAAGDTVTKTLDDGVGGITKTLDDAADSVAVPVSGRPSDPVRGLLDGQTSGGGSIRTEVLARSGPIHRHVVRGASDPLVGGSIGIASDPRVSAVRDAGGKDAGARTMSSLPSDPPADPSRNASDPSPTEPVAAGAVLALIAIIALRSASAPPPGWQYRLLRPIVFDGAAVALAVERPG